jgi:hypothetical protein
MASPVMGEILSGIQDAMLADEFRLDASDAMPPWIGGGGGAFLEGMVRLFEEGSLENLDALSLEIAQDIEAARVEHDGPPG